MFGHREASALMCCLCVVMFLGRRLLCCTSGRAVPFMPDQPTVFVLCWAVCAPSTAVLCCTAPRRLPAVPRPAACQRCRPLWCPTLCCRNAAAYPGCLLWHQSHSRQVSPPAGCLSAEVWPSRQGSGVCRSCRAAGRPGLCYWMPHQAAGGTATA